MSQPNARTAVRSALLTASALVLTAIFLDHHRAELGSFSSTVPAFIANMNRYGVLNIQSAAHSTVGVLAAVLVVVAWYGLGAVLLGSVRSAVGAGFTRLRGPPARSSSRRHAPWEREPGRCFGSRSAWSASIGRVRRLRPSPEGSPSRRWRWSAHGRRAAHLTPGTGPGRNDRRWGSWRHPWSRSRWHWRSWPRSPRRQPRTRSSITWPYPRRSSPAAASSMSRTTSPATSRSGPRCTVCGPCSLAGS